MFSVPQETRGLRVTAAPTLLERPALLRLGLRLVTVTSPRERRSEAQDSLIKTLRPLISHIRKAVPMRKPVWKAGPRGCAARPSHSCVRWL